jgi:hypothetical protein
VIPLELQLPTLSQPGAVGRLGGKFLENAPPANVDPAEDNKPQGEQQGCKPVEAIHKCKAGRDFLSRNRRLSKRKMKTISKNPRAVKMRRARSNISRKNWNKPIHNFT